MLGCILRYSLTCDSFLRVAHKSQRARAKPWTPVWGFGLSVTKPHLTARLRSGTLGTSSIHQRSSMRTITITAFNPDFTSDPAEELARCAVGTIAPGAAAILLEGAPTKPLRIDVHRLPDPGLIKYTIEANSQQYPHGPAPCSQLSAKVVEIQDELRDLLLTYTDAPTSAAQAQGMWQKITNILDLVETQARSLADASRDQLMLHSRAADIAATYLTKANKGTL